MEGSNGDEGLEFPCECVSKNSGYSDPWAGVAQKRLLPNGTKEGILNLLADKPKTVAQLAKALNLAQPTILRHVGEMMTSELLRESEEWERRYPAERYYEPNFPIIRADDHAAFESLCEEMSEALADLFAKRRNKLEAAFNKTGLPEGGWEFADLAQYLFARVQRGARKTLEERGILPPPEKHTNGVEWVFWAEDGRNE
ncbi:MAG: ArsR/SmtB family transcription factor [Blastocatellia bacterium]